MYKKSKLLTLIFLSLTPLVFGKDAPRKEKVAAWVNDSEIYEHEVSEKMGPVMEHLKRKYSGHIDESLKIRIRAKALETLIQYKTAKAWDLWAKKEKEKARIKLH